MIAYVLFQQPVFALNQGDDAVDMTPEAMWQLGLQYEHGENVKQDPDEAIRLYCRSARKGWTGAAYQLGWIYANGRGVPRNDAVAAAWFALAAADGDQHALRMLDRLGVPAEEQQRRCLLSDNSEFLPPLKSVPDPDRSLVETWVVRLAPEYDLHAGLVLAVIEIESGFNSRARSIKDAHGLMQLLPETARRFGVSNINDPLENLRGGMAYLRWLMDYFDGELELVLAGYNAGEKAVERYRGIPPYAETRSYVRQVLRIYRKTGDQPVAVSTDV